MSPREVLVRSLVGRSRVYVAVGDWKACSRDVARAVQEAFPIGDAGLLGLVLLRQAEVRVMRGDPEGALHSVAQARRYYKQARDVRGIVATLREEANTLRELARFEEAVRKIYQAVRLAQKFCETDEEAHNLHRMGQIYLEHGDVDQAERCCREALAIYEKLNHLQGQADALNNLGLVLWTRGLLEEALEALKRAAKIDERRGDRASLTVIYHNIALIYRALYRYEQAHQYYRMSRDLSRQQGYPLGEGVNLLGEGKIFMDTGRFGLARHRLHRAAAIFQRLNNPLRLAGAYIDLGWIEHITGSPWKALQILRRALRMMEEVGFPGGIFWATHHIARILVDEGWIRMGEKWYTKAREEPFAANDAKAGTAVRLLHAAILSSQGAPEEARRLLDQVVHEAEASGLRTYVVEALLLRGRLTVSLEDGERALQLASELGLRAEAARAKILLARLLAARGETRRARTLLREAERYARRAGHRLLLREFQSLRELLHPARGRKNVSS